MLKKIFIALAVISLALLVALAVGEVTNYYTELGLAERLSEMYPDEPDIAHYDALSEIKLGHLFAEECGKFFD